MFVEEKKAWLEQESGLEEEKVDSNVILGRFFKEMSEVYKNDWGDNYPPNMNDRYARELGII